MNTKEIEFGKAKDESIVNTDRVSCDGGENGHPRVYLTVSASEVTICPYCSHKFLKSSKSIKN